MKSVVLALSVLFAAPVFAANLRKGALVCQSENSMRRAWPLFTGGETEALNRLIQRSECGYVESSIAVEKLRGAEPEGPGQCEVNATSWRGSVWTHSDFLAPDEDTLGTRILSLEARLAFDEMDTMAAYAKSAQDGGVPAMNRFRAEALASGRMIQLPARAYVVMAVGQINARIKLGGIFVTSGAWEDLQTELKRTGRHYFVGISAEQFTLIPHQPMRMDGQKKTEEPVESPR